MFSVAKQRLPDTMREHRAKLESVTAVAIGKMTVGDATRVYLEKVRASVSLKPRSKDYQRLTDLGEALAQTKEIAQQNLALKRDVTALREQVDTLQAQLRGRKSDKPSPSPSPDDSW